MKQIDQYVNSIYRNVSGDPQEIEDLRQEMRSHLIESVEELTAQGKTEKEAIRISIENFGGESQIEKELSEYFTVQKRFTNYVLSFALLFLAVSIFFFINALTDVKDFNKEVNDLKIVEREKQSIMDDAFDILDSTNEVTKKEQDLLLGIFEKYQEQLNFLAVFPASGSADFLKNDENVLNQPTTHFPIDYEQAAVVIGDSGIVENKEEIVPSDYDLGTVMMANEQWIVQYEYNRSYEKTVEMQHQLKHYGPSFWNFYQLPILFLALFIVLAIVWIFLNRQGRHLKNVMK